jgi:hypothetical protein
MIARRKPDFGLPKADGGLEKGAIWDSADMNAEAKRCK